MSDTMNHGFIGSPIVTVLLVGLQSPLMISCFKIWTENQGAQQTEWKQSNRSPHQTPLAIQSSLSKTLLWIIILGLKPKDTDDPMIYVSGLDLSLIRPRVNQDLG